MSGQRNDGENLRHDESGIETFEGQEFEVVLADLPGAGYEWVPREVPPGLVLLTADWADPLPGQAGASRRRSFRLAAERPGSFRLVFQLVRPWESADVAPAGEHTVSVEVAPYGH
jgi:predicted secreted protein